MEPIVRILLPCLIMMFTAFSCEKEEDKKEETFEVRCNNDELEGKISEIILGKWEVIGDYKESKLVNGEIIDVYVYIRPPHKVIEFSQDSIYKESYYYNGELKIVMDKYWIDTLLHFKIDIRPWEYGFCDNDMLKLSNAFPAGVDLTSIYKRIK
ncbi:hypothetical protein ES705_27788 [subsurface metagenome]